MNEIGKLMIGGLTKTAIWPFSKSKQTKREEREMNKADREPSLGVERANPPKEKPSKPC